METAPETPYRWDGAVGYWLAGTFGDDHPAATEEERSALLAELETALRSALAGDPPRETSPVVRAMLCQLGAVRAALENEWSLQRLWPLNDVDVHSEEVTLAVLSIPDLTTENLRQQDVTGGRSLGYVTTLLTHPACTQELLVDVVARGWSGRPERAWPKVGALRLLAEQGGMVRAAVALVQLPVRGLGGIERSELTALARTLGEAGDEASEVLATLTSDLLRSEGRGELDPQEVPRLVEQACLVARRT